MSFEYFSNCAKWPPELVDVEGGLDDMIEARQEVTARQFVNKVGKSQAVELAHEEGYTGPTKGYSNPRHPQHQPDCMSMEEDPAGVQFYKSELFGREVWYARMSGVEHVFIPKGWTPTPPVTQDAGAAPKGSHVFFSDCPSWPRELVDVPGGLIDMQEHADHVSMEVFLENVCPADMLKQAHALHYTGITKAHNDPEHPDHNPRAKAKSMEEDYHVQYERGQFLGREVWFFVHSAQEYAFIPPGWTPSLDDVDWDFDPDENDTPRFG